MTTQKHTTLFTRVDAWEHRLCLYFNHFNQHKSINRFFSAISRLGNGEAWYLLIATLPFICGFEGYVVGLGMSLVALINVIIYKTLKHRLVRERPYISFVDVACGTPPLDRYSFPSGHTLHAVSFTTVCVFFFPIFAPVLIPIALLIAASRVILGLHYPTDVAVGALIGSVVSASLIPLISVSNELAFELAQYSFSILSFFWIIAT